MLDDVSQVFKLSSRPSRTRNSPASYFVQASYYMKQHAATAEDRASVLLVEHVGVPSFPPRKQEMCA